MNVAKNLKEKTGRKGLEEAVEAARQELTRLRKALDEANIARTSAAIRAEKGSYSERKALRNAEDAFVRLQTEVEETEASLKAAETALVDHMAATEDAGVVAFREWMHKALRRVEKLGAALRKLQEEEIPIAKEMVAVRLETERRAPKKLVARPALRRVQVEVLDEAMKGYVGEKTHMEFFSARRAAKEGKVRIIPDENFVLQPGEVEYEKRDRPLPKGLEIVKAINLGLLFPCEDMREELDFNAIEKLLTPEDIAQAIVRIEGGA